MDMSIKHQKNLDQISTLCPFRENSKMFLMGNHSHGTIKDGILLKLSKKTSLT
ncbi:hypothetical protein CAEBREN_19727 [Caenorhabditis brenneri]|uniref:Uncharacterized protein n=1 Tax=Caenorhabditis brenneri TaxID=135651 RepID=G0P2U3_CAEBE|nr:hypothetical protein CAEBREN_19727 [Caenorhabditis brenneri]